MLNVNSFSQQIRLGWGGGDGHTTKVSNFPNWGHVYTDKSSNIRGASTDGPNQSEKNIAHLAEQTFNLV